MDWDEVGPLIADLLARTVEQRGPSAIYGGSYGWGSAGRFHHPQSQVHRFLNCLGGYVSSENTYSTGASNVILPWILSPEQQLTRGGITLSEISESCELVVAFGGLSPKNQQVSPGGMRQHPLRHHLAKARERGCAFVNVSPIRDDMAHDLDAEWLPLRPGSDVALMLALAHHWLDAGLVDEREIRAHTYGLDELKAYLFDQSQPRDAAWAAKVTGLDAAAIVRLADTMAARRTLISVSWSLQRSRYGETPIWLGVVLAALLGRLDTPGRGFAYGLGSTGQAGRPKVGVPLPTMPQGTNPVADSIPVARIADMLLDPGGTYRYNGRSRTYPSVDVVYWCGGNPFHHHQDLARLDEAFTRPEAVVVHEQFWTATARRADFVLPVTMTIERDDLAASPNEPLLTAMPRLVEPFADARDDFSIFQDLARRLGVANEFDEGRSASEWLRHLYETMRAASARSGATLPGFEEFWESGSVTVPTEESGLQWLRQFWASPDDHPLPTPTGRIEIFSQSVESFDVPGLPGLPIWNEPAAPDERFPLVLLANQPARRLHSQLEVGAHSRSGRVAGREPLRMNPADAADRGLRDRQPVRVFNSRGAFLATLVTDGRLRRGVVQMSTGARYEPVAQEDGTMLCVNGNPNVLTNDIGTSELAQGCTGATTAVEVGGAPEPVAPVAQDHPPTLRTPRPESRAQTADGLSAETP
jgi:biotin/methionine sulfoxide reductase